MNQRLLSFLIITLLTWSSVSAQSKRISPKKDYVVTLSTTLGDIYLVLFDETPKHKENFIKLAEEDFYVGITFHRVMKGFMIQGGDPNSKPDGDHDQIGRGSPGYTLDAEFKDEFKHDKGMLAAARQPDRVNPEKKSNGSQFYIVQNEKGAHHLDGSYTIFGKVIAGLDVVDKIADQKVDRRNKPFEDISILEVKAKALKRKKIKKLYNYPEG